jgi:hypothetical protein
LFSFWAACRGEELVFDFFQGASDDFDMSLFPPPRFLLTLSRALDSVAFDEAKRYGMAWQSRSFIFFSVSFHRGLFWSDDPSVYRSFFQQACFSCSCSVTSASVNTKHIQRYYIQRY